MQKGSGRLCIIAACSLMFTACNSSKNDAEVKPAADTASQTVITQDTSNADTTYAAQPVTNATRYFYGPNVSVISGTLTSEMFYGPPGYGENPEEDMQEQVYVLTLENPVKVFSNSPEQEADGFDVARQNVERIQLMSSKDLSFTPYVNRRVQLTGTFFGAHTGHHHTDVLMDVEKLIELK